jgi:hypothetical protein
VTIPSFVAGSVTTTADDVAPVRAPDEKLRVNVPPPLMPSPENVATPDELVDALGVPTSDAPPPVTAAKMLTLAWLTLLPDASRSWTAGAVENATPLAADPGGCVAITRTAAAPAVIEIVPDDVPLSPDAENCSV